MTDIETTEKAKITEFVSLRAGGQGYCVEITSIREIRRWRTVTSLPNSDKSILGVMNLRGAVIPIIDLAARLGLQITEVGPRSVVVVVAVGNRVIGLLVEAVSEILSIVADEIQPNPTQGHDGNDGQVVGLVSVEEEMLKILALDTIVDRDAEEVA
ncbi:chemotaxis protein CheW [Cognatiyoonia sp. IB215446]|uniref:chemotaxis protein CheW n=1 Tax=Cognatiyoonia sp. IB215446 TaxID=3097355 RepID=UPI002A0DE909|nr:chemotaxis protein CheW [Cognatiyoonia sp. IB215446]MDX8348587.1 chemotaxis protein CheW [Cognatiyoonia sp. IB215446]